MDFLNYWTVLLYLFSFLLIYWVLTKDFDYWSKRGINGPKPLPGIGSFYDLFMSEKTLRKLDWINKYGKIYGAKTPVLTVADPEILKIILVKDFHMFPERRDYKSYPQHPIGSKNLFMATNDIWKRLRVITSPTFSSAKLKKMLPSVNDCLKTFKEQLEVYANEKKDFNCYEMFGHCTMDVLTTCCFATKINSYKDSDNPIVKHAQNIKEFDTLVLILMLVLPRPVLDFFNIVTAFPQKSMDFLCNSTRNIMNNRRKNGKNHNDFIQLLMDAELDKDDEKQIIDYENVRDENSNTISTTNYIDKRLTEEEILAQALVFFVAGFETTTTALSYATYELTLNPEIQEKLYAEVKSIGEPTDVDYDPDVLANLPYLDAVVCETLRHHPPLVKITRNCKADYELAEIGLKLFKGQLVEIPIYLIHHLEEFHPDPYKFNPERFLPENKHLIKPYTYLPFGEGPRYCIGMRFALQEIKSALAQIVKRYKFVSSNRTAVPLNYRKHWFFNVPDKIFVGIEKRI